MDCTDLHLPEFLWSSQEKNVEEERERVLKPTSKYYGQEQV